MANEFRNCPLWEDHKNLLTQDEVEDVVRQTVKETLLSMGIDTTNPLEMQRDFQTLRDWRTTMNTIRSRGVMTIVGIVVAGLLGALWVGLKHGLR